MMEQKGLETGIPPLSPPVNFDGKSDEDVNESTSIGSLEEKKRFATLRENGFAKKVWAFVTWTPKRCRWNPDNPPKFSTALNLLFGFVSLL